MIHSADDLLDDVFHALSNRTRRALLHRLAEGPARVTELAAPHGMTVNAISKHLFVLERAGLLRRTRNGHVQSCALEAAPMATAEQWMLAYRGFWSGKLDSLAEFFENEKATGTEVRPTELRLTRLIQAGRDEVFAAWTDPAILERWWGPGPVTCPEAHIDLREGGTYRIANKETDGSIIWISGHFERIRKPEELVYTWKVSILPDEATRVRVQFLVHPAGTELVLTHERFLVEPVRDMHLEGWNACIDKLEAMLALA